MMLPGPQPPQSPSTTAHSTTTTTNAPPVPATVHHDGLVDAGHDGRSDAQHAGRKRKADSQDNERLSKRLSLLNLEKNGSKLYVPVENPNAEPIPVDGNRSATAAQPSAQPPAQSPEDSMQLDDSKYKVYIYNIDDELSSDNDSDAADDGKLVFLPDIEKHLKANRIPPRVLANNEGELAGMQMVLYNDPKSLSVPENKDSVRKAIIESRNRLREKQQGSPTPAGDTKTETVVDTPVQSNGFQDTPIHAPPASEAMDMDVDMD